MATPPTGPMEVVFSFDTTGSMSQVLDEVKARVNDIIQRLQADIPGFKFGVIAHGDYCDSHHFYDIKTLDLTNNLAEIVMFVNNTEGTGGGDIPECYELALRHARDMSWAPTSRRVLVVIGDAYPHEPDYDMNKLNIDWREELLSLVKMGVRIYGVQIGDDPESTSFFKKLTNDSGGQHLKLANMSTICSVIMGICYREQGTEMFQNYEKELRETNSRNFGPDLEAVFGAMRVEEVTSDAETAKERDQSSSHGDESHSSDPCAAVLSVAGQRSASSSRKNGDSESMIKRTARIQQLLHKGAKKSTATANKKHVHSVRNKEDVINKNCKKASGRPHKSAKDRRVRKGSLSEDSKGDITNVTRLHKAKTDQKLKKISSDRKIKEKHFRQRRETERASDFKYSHLPWSDWQLAVSQKKPDLAGRWKTLPRRGCGAFWKRDLLEPCISQLETYPQATTIFELGIRKKRGTNIEVVCFHATNVCRRANYGVFGLPWYSGMFKGVRDVLSSAVCSGYNVYVRFAIVKSNIKRQILRDYSYAWLTGRRIKETKQEGV